jgi:acyl carrier protein
MTIEEKIITLIKENSNCESAIYRHSNIIDDLSIDSFDRLMIINAIEDEYAIEVDTNDIDRFRTVDDIVLALESKYVNPVQ